MNYQKIYNEIINKRRQYPIDMGICYCEKHHIIPKCMNGSNDDQNLVNLTAREHYLCHVLLAKIYQNTQYEHSLLCSVIRTLQENGKKRRNLKYNSRLIGILKERKAYVCSRKITYNGLTMTIREWSKYTGIKYDLLRKRISVMPFEKAISVKKLINDLHDINGVKHTIREWSKIYNQSYFLVKNRMSKGMTLEQALSIPKKVTTRLKYKGKYYTINELSKLIGLSKSLIRNRVKKFGEEYFKHLIPNKGIYSYNGKTYTMKQLQQIYNLPKNVIMRRIQRGISLTLPYYRRTKIAYKGK